MKIFNDIQVGIQSWCFHGLNGNNGVIAALKECKIDCLEICEVHVDVNNKEQVGEVLKLYSDNGITLSSFGINKLANNEDVLRPIYEFAKKAGISVIGADPDPDAYMLLEKLCEEYSVKLAIHNHGRNDRYGRINNLRELFEKTSLNFGLCLDTAWLLDAGDDPVEAIKMFSDRLYGIHFKDFKFDEKGDPEETVLGTGVLNLEKVINTLKDVNFKGYATIEYEGEPENPVPNIKKCVEKLKSFV